MKLQILSFLLLAFITSTAQNRKPEPFKGANKIVVVNTSDAQTNFKTAITALLEHGYSIERKDDEYFTIKTQPRTIPKSIITCFFNLYIKDSTIIISGMYDSNMGMNVGLFSSRTSFQDIVNKGMYDSDYKKAFAAMRKLSALFPGTVYYEKR